MRLALLTCFVLALVCVHAVDLAAQSEKGLEGVLRRPVSPGTLALLIEHTKEPGAQRRIGDALSHPSPEVRAAAARVMFAAGLRELIPQLVVALGVEQAPDPAIEQMRALRRLGGEDHKETVSAASARLALSDDSTADLSPDGTPDSKQEQPELRSAERVTIQTPARYPPGFVKDVLAASGCTEGKARLNGVSGYGAGAGIVAFRGDGRSARVTVSDTRLRRECADAVRVLLMTHVVERHPAAQDEERMVVISLDPEFVACREAQTPRQARRAGTGLTGPTKTRHVNPYFQESAQRDRAQGIVILDAVIGASGCIQEVHVLKGIDQRLDIAALLAVVGWRFTPIRIEGQPIKVAMTVTVMFSYQ